LQAQKAFSIRHRTGYQWSGMSPYGLFTLAYLSTDRIFVGLTCLTDKSDLIGCAFLRTPDN